MNDPFQPPMTQQPTPGRREWKLRRIGVLSAGIFGGAAGVTMGLIAAVFLLVFAGFGAGLQGGAGGPNPQLSLLSMGAGLLFMLPLLYGIGGFFGGVINALIYNVVASMTGGIQMEFE